MYIYIYIHSITILTYSYSFCLFVHPCFCCERCPSPVLPQGTNSGDRLWLSGGGVQRGSKDVHIERPVITLRRHGDIFDIYHEHVVSNGGLRIKHGE